MKIDYSKILKNNLINAFKDVLKFIEKNGLILFPSWLEHNGAPSNYRISIAFNVFAKGMFGIKNSTNELYL